MGAEEKAKELFNKMVQTISGNCEHDSYCEEKECQWKGMVVCKTAQAEAKQCALICVDEILKTIDPIPSNEYSYWQQVHKLIENL